jgi:hypothetical protein
MCLVASGFALLLSSPAQAQGGVPLVTVATDQSQLNLPNQFGIPAGSAINQAGDLAFIGNGESALFFRASGSSSVVRLLQRGDAAPNIPNSNVTGFSPIVSINSLKHIYFGITFSLADTLPHSALLIYDGTNYHAVVSAGEIAPHPTTSLTPVLHPAPLTTQGTLTSPERSMGNRVSRFTLFLPGSRRPCVLCLRMTRFPLHARGVVPVPEACRISLLEIPFQQIPLSGRYAFPH